jgi:uncharacterized RDD family membrane protein YckC
MSVTVSRTLRLAGFATRAIALAVDAAIVNAAVAVTGVIVALALGLFGVDSPATPIRALLGCAGWILLVGLYFATFWTLAGQTPGMRFMGIHVIGLDGRIPGRRRAFRRAWALFLAALPFGAGFALVLVDDRRRGLHDRIARTLVVHDDEEETVVLEPAPEPVPVEASGTPAVITRGG